MYVLPYEKDNSIPLNGKVINSEGIINDKTYRHLET